MRYVVGNWKMNETAREGEALARSIVASLGSATRGVTVAVAPPFTALSAVGDALSGSTVALAAQNLFWEERGAYTGEVSAPMLVDLGVAYVIVGHSERRRLFGESDEDVRRKVRAALDHGLRPIVAVGESAEERDAGATDARVTAQMRAAFEGNVRDDERAKVLVAYEPLWAIGTGRSCEPSEADRVMRLLKASVAGFDGVPVLYGGSVSPTNFSGYLALSSCGGTLAGGASLDAGSFVSLVRLAAG